MQPYSETYSPTHNVPIVHAATAFQCQHTGQTYILIMNECLWMGKTMQHSLINPNQLRHFGTKIRDDPTSRHPVCLVSPDRDIEIPLQIDGTIIYYNTHTPTPEELDSCERIVLSSSQPWDPKNVRFSQTGHSSQGKLSTNYRHLSAFTHDNTKNNDIDEQINIFNLSSIKRRIFSMKIAEIDDTQNASFQNPLIDSGTSDIPTIPTFQSSQRHTDVSPEDLSERWHISLPQALSTLKNTTQRFLRSATLPLSRRYISTCLHHTQRK